jgi:hypothetical protein
VDYRPCQVDQVGRAFFEEVEKIVQDVVLVGPYSCGASDWDPGYDGVVVGRTGLSAYLSNLLGRVDLVGSSPRWIVKGWGNFV